MTVLNYDCHQVIGMILFLYQIDVQILWVIESQL